MTLIDFVESIDSGAGDFEGEIGRFKMIFDKHIKAKGKERSRLRGVLAAYLRYSLQSTELIHALIQHCIELDTPDRLDIAIDVLAVMGNEVYEYANNFLIADVSNWNNLYSDRPYEPSDDYWYILLRSLARSGAEESRKLFLISKCSNANSRGLIEAVVESLGDMETPAAYGMLKPFASHLDPFISKLATEILEEE